VDNALVGIVFRVLHILAAITAVGGTIYMRMALLPATTSLDEETRQRLQQELRRRWMIPLNASILFLLVSGLFNLMSTLRTYEVPGYYNALFGIKFLLAMAIFFFASVLSGRSPGTEKFRQNARTWLTLNMVLGITLVCISGVLRVAEKIPKPPAEEQTTVTENIGKIPLPKTTLTTMLE